MLRQQKGRDQRWLYWKKEHGAIVTQPALTRSPFSSWDLPSGGGGWISNDDAFKQRGTRCTQPASFLWAWVRRLGWALWIWHWKDSKWCQSVPSVRSHRAKTELSANTGRETQPKCHEWKLLLNDMWALGCIYCILRWKTNFWVRGVCRWMRSAVRTVTMWVEFPANIQAVPDYLPQKRHSGKTIDADN